MIDVILLVIVLSYAVSGYRQGLAVGAVLGMPRVRRKGAALLVFGTGTLLVRPPLCSHSAELF